MDVEKHGEGHFGGSGCHFLSKWKSRQLGKIILDRLVAILSKIKVEKAILDRLAAILSKMEAKKTGEGNFGEIGCHSLQNGGRERCGRPFWTDWLPLSPKWRSRRPGKVILERLVAIFFKMDVEKAGEGNFGEIGCHSPTRMSRRLGKAIL